MCPNDEYETVRTKASYLYKEDNVLSDKTLCMSAQLGDKSQFRNYELHNLSPLMESIVTMDAAQKLNNSRGFLVSKSTFVGSGHYSGYAISDNLSVNYQLVPIIYVQ